LILCNFRTWIDHLSAKADILNESADLPDIYRPFFIRT
jgi:hypothetical protein